MDNNNPPTTLHQVDALIATLTEGDFDEAGKLRAEQIRESWRKAREMVVDHEYKLKTLIEMRRLIRDRKTRTNGIATERVLHHAMKLQPQQTAELLRKWRVLQIVFTEEQLDQMYSNHREERREQARLELQRLFELGGDDK